MWQGDRFLSIMQSLILHPDLDRRTLRMLQEHFWHVFFIPGNHELWVKGPPERHHGAEDSVAKLGKVLALCRSMGVQVRTPRGSMGVQVRTPRVESCIEDRHIHGLVFARFMDSNDENCHHRFLSSGGPSGPGP